jgi:hypothetical protein
MIRAYRLYTGSDGNSHVVRGSVRESKLVDAQSILFSFDWHNDPIPNMYSPWQECSNLQPLAARPSRSITVMCCLQSFTRAQDIGGV